MRVERGVAGVWLGFGVFLAGFAWASDGEPEGSFSDPEDLSGGTTTVFQTGRMAYAMPLANLGRENRRAHAVGNSFFNKNWVLAPASTAERDGLGPLFLARSCSECHVRDGRGRPPEAGEPMGGLLFRFSIPGRDETGGPVPDPHFGTQLATRAIPGIDPEGEVTITHREIAGAYDDGTPFSLREPVYRLATNPAHGEPHPKLMMSPRIAPPVFGLGLLEAIEEETILALADPDDTDGDGISGRPNRVWNREKQRRQLGRFGWKAGQPDLRHQVASAFVSDIGITSPLVPEEDLTVAQRKAIGAFESGGSPELEERIFERVVAYQKTLAPPARRNREDPMVSRGKELFHEAGCAGCHVPSLRTADSVPGFEELAAQTIFPYTDLLLHDMGPQLADGRPDGEAGGREWRTPPLWGIGLTRAVNGHERFLHDGRARGLEEAILWHGGEGEASREAFRRMSGDERERLIAFLNSL